MLRSGCVRNSKWSSQLGHLCLRAAEPTDEADRGRHSGFARHEGLAGGPGSLSLSFGGRGLRGVEWLVPWHPVADDPTQFGGMEGELARELAAEHPLFGLPMRTLARRQDCDDVLF